MSTALVSQGSNPKPLGDTLHQANAALRKYCPGRLGLKVSFLALLGWKKMLEKNLETARGSEERATKPAFLPLPGGGTQGSSRERA
jgi:hypothetical protein